MQLQKKFLFIENNIEVNFHGRGSPKERACILFTVRFEPGEITVNLNLDQRGSVVI